MPGTRELIAAARKIRAEAKKLRAKSKWLRMITQRHYRNPPVHPISFSEAQAESERARLAAQELADQKQAEKLAAIRHRRGIPDSLSGEAGGKDQTNRP